MLFSVGLPLVLVPVVETDGQEPTLIAGRPIEVDPTSTPALTMKVTVSLS